MTITFNNIRNLISSHRREITVVILVTLVFGAYALSGVIKSRDYSVAGVFLSGGTNIHEVYLYSDRVMPQTVSAKVGDTIRFVGKDDGFHDISTRRTSARNTEARITSGEFGVGDSYEIQFQAVGTYGLYDRLHQDINVTVVVER